jgi:paraquat-inducible protein B
VNDLAPLPEALPQASVRKRRRFSLIWAIPIVTLLIAAWLAWDTISKRGPVITVTFTSAEGLVAGTSHVRHKDIDMGLVTSIALTKDLNSVIVTAQMNREATPLLTEHSRLWVVKPRFFAGNISGLDTLLSGAYIELLPSPEGGDPKADFVGLEDPPVLEANEPGHTFLLRANRLGAINVGSPVFFRDLTVGQVLGWDLGDMAESVTIHAFVRAPFDKYVRRESRFWNASGVSLELGAQGVQLQMDSIRALLLGGVEFDTPENASRDSATAADQTFRLYANQEAATNAGFSQRIPAIGYFQGSVDGLAPGSPVTFQGLRIGEVTGVRLAYDPKTDSIIAPVTYEVQPGRIADVSPTAEARGPVENARLLVRKGLRAQLKSVNLITGQMGIALDMVPDAAPAELEMKGDVIVIPTVPGELASLSKSVTSLVNKITNLPFADIGAKLDGVLTGVNTTVNNPDILTSVKALESTLQTVQNLAKNLDAGSAPAMKRLPQIATNLESTLTKANALLGSAATGYGDNSSFHRDLDRVLSELVDTARSIRVLADLLTRHPEALVRGRTNTGAE